MAKNSSGPQKHPGWNPDSTSIAKTTSPEKMLGLDIIYRELDSGDTAKSVNIFKRVRARLGKLRAVILACGKLEHGWDARTYVVDEDQRAIRLSGFSWGYLGEGSRGLEWLFKEIGFRVDMEHLPEHGKLGCWLVSPNGTVTSAN